MAGLANRNFSFIVDGVLAGCARPVVGKGGDDDLAEFAERGIAGVVSLTQQPLDAAAVERAGLAYLHLPVVDFTAPTMDQVRAFVGFVRQVTAAGRGAVVVHCGAGVGRTGTMAACYLVSEGRAAEDAIREVRRTRPNSVETDKQEDAVREWERLVARDEGA